MQVHTEFKLQIDTYDKVQLRCRTAEHDDDLSAFNRLATLTLATGACNLQTYLTAVECRQLAFALTRAASDIEARSERAKVAA